MGIVGAICKYIGELCPAGDVARGKFGEKWPCDILLVAFLIHVLNQYKV
jgi:hypothetical protein